MTEHRRKRVTCPVCDRRVSLTTTGLIGWHKNPAGIARTCKAAGKLTGADAVKADLERLAKLVARYPERARELIAGGEGPRPAGHSVKPR